MTTQDRIDLLEMRMQKVEQHIADLLKRFKYLNDRNDYLNQKIGDYATMLSAEIGKIKTHITDKELYNDLRRND